MKKAFDALNEKGLSYEFHDYKKQGIDAETLKVWLEKIGADTLLNKKVRHGASYLPMNNNLRSAVKRI